MPAKKLCLLDDIQNSQAREFILGSETRLFVVRDCDEFYGYINQCPHLNWPLNISPSGFLDSDKNYIQCANHMALFEIQTGLCVAGPCVKQALKPVTLSIKSNELWAEFDQLNAATTSS